MASVTPTGVSTGTFDPWLSSNHWTGPTVTYSFPTDGSSYSYHATSAISSLSSSQKAVVRATLAEIASFTGLSFVEMAETSTSEATLRFATKTGLAGALAYLPSSTERGGDVVFGSNTANPTMGNEAYLYFTHEIGHAMGLNHGHEYSSFVSSGKDSQEYTVVTYTDYVGDTDVFSFDSGPVDWAQSYMQLDIAAMQFLYGANYSTTNEDWSGDSVYTFNRNTGEMSINGNGIGVPAGNRIFRTIWDGDGVDTYDLRNYSDDLEIDLAPGAFSVFSTTQLADLNKTSSDSKFDARGNVANALLVDGDKRALIENAIGGSGDDVIKGNAAANTLTGNRGDDWLHGKGGADNLDGGAGRDTLKGGKGDDWLEGGNLNDKLYGQVGRDTIKGGAGGDRMYGGNGDDRMFGGKGHDIIVGNEGRDFMTGGTGRDVFRFVAASDSATGSLGDHIRDFDSGKDTIDLSKMTGPAFTLSLLGGFSGTGASVKTREVGGDTIVLADVDGDGSADFRIKLDGVTGLSIDDFIL